MKFDLNGFIDKRVLLDVEPQQKKDYRNKINLSSNELHSLYMDLLLKKFINNVDADILCKYPYYHAFIKEYAEFIHLEENSVIFTPGSDFGIYLLLTALTHKKCRIINFVPNYISYEKYSLYNNNAIYENIYFKQSFEEIKTSLKTYTNSIVILTNPNGFDGDRFDKEQVDCIVDICRDQNNLLILDEAYAAFDGFERNDLLMKPENQHLIIVRSFSKCFGIAGLRLGCILANSEIISYLARWNPTNTVSSFSMAFFSFCLKQQDLLKKIRDEIHENRKKITSIFSQKTFVWPSHTNFIACQFINNETKERALDLFKQRNTIVKDISKIYGYNHSLRITVPSEQELEVCEFVINRI